MDSNKKIYIGLLTLAIVKSNVRTPTQPSTTKELTNQLLILNGADDKMSPSTCPSFLLSLFEGIYFYVAFNSLFFNFLKSVCLSWYCDKVVRPYEDKLKA